MGKSRAKTLQNPRGGGVQPESSCEAQGLLPLSCHLFSRDHPSYGSDGPKPLSTLLRVQSPTSPDRAGRAAQNPRDWRRERERGGRERPEWGQDLQAVLSEQQFLYLVSESVPNPTSRQSFQAYV